MNSCKNCNELVSGNYCSNCGHATNLKRIDGSYVIREIASSFNTESGMIYTIRMMFLAPGKSVKQFLLEDRNRFVKPISFILITALIAIIVSHFFKIDAKVIQQQFSDEADIFELPTYNLLINWLIDNSYSDIVVGFIMAFWVKLFFRKSGYNLFEIFVLYCYLIGISSIFTSVIFTIQGLTHLNLIIVSNIITVIYLTWATGQFFNRRKASSYLKAFISYILGFYMVGFLVVLIAIFVDIILK